MRDHITANATHPMQKATEYPANCSGDKYPSTQPIVSINPIPTKIWAKYNVKEMRPAFNID
jgi:hypothetical protein